MVFAGEEEKALPKTDRIRRTGRNSRRYAERGGEGEEGEGEKEAMEERGDSDGDGADKGKGKGKGKGRGFQETNFGAKERVWMGLGAR